MARMHSESLPDWMMFIGKWGESAEGHPLVYHMIDSAAVAGHLWQQALTPGARDQFSRWLGLPEEESGRFLSYWTGLHDLGKATPSFQQKHEPTKHLLEARGFHFPTLSRADIRHHSLLSQWILHDFANELNIQPPKFFNQFRFAVGGHHGTFHAAEDQERSLARTTNLGDERWGEARREMFAALTGLIQPPAVPPFQLTQTGRNALFNLLTGFFVAADWVSSQDDLFQYRAARLGLDEYWAAAQQLAQSALQKTGWIGWQPDGARPGFTETFGFHPHPLQQIVLQKAEGLIEPFLMVVEAPTGCGKTEAALLAADRVIQACGLRGCYIAMPTQATSNQMFDRTKKFLEQRYPAQKNLNLQLAHGNAVLNETFQGMRLAAITDDEGQHEGNVNAMEWFLPRKRTLLAPFGVGTVDQTFLSVLRARHSFLRLFGLHRKVVIFDEVHAYDTYMMEIFHQLLAWMRAVGTSVILLSATLPEETRLDLLRAYQPGATVESPQAPYPRLSVNDGRNITTASLGEFPDRTVHIRRVSRDPNTWMNPLPEKLTHGGCAAVICNTVDRAQEVYRLIQNMHIVADQDLMLLHARMPFCWRKDKEEIILKRFGKLDQPASTPRSGIVVATQIIEQSLDLDFDLLITDLAPIDLLIQRIGRLHRHTGSAYPPQRPPGIEKPTCWICQPDSPGEGDLPGFEKDIFVYDNFILQRTYFTLQPYQSLDLPGDSDALINTVYSDDPLLMCNDAQNRRIHRLYLDLLKKQEEEITSAENRLVGNVDLSNVLGEKTAYLREESRAVGDNTRALTRNTVLPSVQLVCFIEKDGKIFLLDEMYPFPIDVLPKGKALECALRSMVSVSKRAVVEHFYQQPRHEPWRMQPSMRFAYPVVFTQGKCTLDSGIILVLDEQTGLSIVDGGQ